MPDGRYIHLEPEMSKKAADNIIMVTNAAQDACNSTNPEQIVSCHVILLTRASLDMGDHTAPIIGTLVTRTDHSLIKPEVALAQAMELLQKQLQRTMNQKQLASDRDNSGN